MGSVLLRCLLAFVAIVSYVDGGSRNYFLVGRTDLVDQSDYDARSPMARFLMHDYLYSMEEDEQSMEYLLPEWVYDSFMTGRDEPSPMVVEKEKNWRCRNSETNVKARIKWVNRRSCARFCQDIFPDQVHCYKLEPKTKPKPIRKKPKCRLGVKQPGCPHN